MGRSIPPVDALQLTAVVQTISSFKLQLSIPNATFHFSPPRFNVGSVPALRRDYRVQ